MMISNEVPKNFIVAPATLSSTGLVLIWDRPLCEKEVIEYRIWQDGELIGVFEGRHTHCEIDDLLPNMNYQFSLVTIFEDGYENSKVVLRVQTKSSHRKIIDVSQPPYSVDVSGALVETQCVQRAIDDCPKNGIVLIPKNCIIRVGALDLKSNMELRVDGELRGSDDPQDYIFNTDNLAECTKYQGKINEDGLILTRYEGWEMYCYRSLINIGYLNPVARDSNVCENIRISGTGKIVGAGNSLGEGMKAIYADSIKYPKYVSDNIPGRRVRGRLVNVIQAKNVHLTGVSFENSPCWTIHLIYSDTVTINGINIDSQGIDNGDGIDPDSCQNMLIFDTTFNTGDDCIAIKSGKNPEGNIINLPSRNINIFDLNMFGGHGMAIGSEQSGGIENITIRDCTIQNTDHGIELKASRERGGFIRNINIENCKIDSFFAHEVKYNADGIGARKPPVIENLKLRNLEITGARRSVDVMGHPIDSKDKAIELIGFQDENNQYYINNVLLQNIIIERSTDRFHLDYCKNIKIQRVVMQKSNLLMELGARIQNINIDQ